MENYILDIFEAMAQKYEESGREQNKHCVGIFKTPQEMARKAGQVINRLHIEGLPVTMTGVSLRLGYAGRQGLYNHENYGDDYVPVVNLIRNFVVAYNEERIYNQPAGSIFMLKNLEPTIYRDKTEQDIKLDNYNYDVEID